jgi:hypothetical protein
LSPARVVEIKAWIVRTPVVENAHQSTLFDQIFYLRLKSKSNPGTIERSLYRQILLAECEVSVGLYGYFDAVALKLPLIVAAAFEPEANAGKTIQFARDSRLWMPLEKLGRSNISRALRAAERHGDHVLGDHVAKANARIKSLRNHIHQRVVDNYLNIDARVGIQKSRHQREQDYFGRGPRGINAQISVRRASEVIEVFECVFDITKGGRNAREKALSGLGRRHAAGRSVQQAYVQRLFQRAQRMTKCRRRDAQFVRSFTEASVPRDGDKYSEIVRCNA